MDLPSAALGAGWLLMVEAIGALVLYLWHQRAPIRKAKQDKYVKKNPQRREA